MITSSLNQFFSGKVRSRGLRNRLARNAVGTFGLKVAATGFSFVISILLARLLGVAGYGAYAYAMAWADLLGVLAIFGLDTLLVRSIATYQAQSAWGLMRGILRWANQTVLIISSALVLLAAGITGLLAERLDFQMLSALWVALFILPLTALTGLRRATMRGLHHTVVGELPEMLIRPLSFIVVMSCIYLFLGWDVSAPRAVGLNIMATGIALISGTLLLYKILPSAVREALPVYQTHLWARSALSMMFISGMYMIHNRTAILMLGTIKEAEAVGIYNVAHRGVQLITFVLTAVNIALSPTIASLYTAGNMQRLQRVITRSAQVVLLVSLPIGVSLIVFGDWFLLLFGVDFTQGRTALAILSVGQLVNASAGTVGTLLLMTGHERDVAMGIGMSTVLNIILNFALIPQWGLEGAATAAAISITAWNVSMAVLTYRRLGIHSTVLGSMRLRKGT